MKCLVYNNVVVVALDGANKSLDGSINLKTMTFKWKREKQSTLSKCTQNYTRAEKKTIMPYETYKTKHLSTLWLQRQVLLQGIAKTADRKGEGIKDL